MRFPAELLAIALLSCMGTTSAQSGIPSPYSFKGNYLGEPLDEFKKANATATVWINTGKPNVFGRSDKKKSLQVPTPLCTDTMREFPGDTETLPDDVVLCNVSPGVTNPDGLRIGTNIASSVLYRVYMGKLYDIAISLYSFEYESVKSAFSTKYGQPSKLTTVPYQNAYGATWTGEASVWSNSSQTIILIEGSGNGPGQSRLSIASAHFTDYANSPPSAKKSPLNF